jgi:hypothetical protein
MPNILWGAGAIAVAANIVDTDGKPDLRKTFYLLEQGLLPGKKVGRKWVSNADAIARALEIATE